MFLIEIIFYSVIGHIFYPLEILLRPTNSKRYLELIQLRIPELCQTIIKNGDFRFEKRKSIEDKEDSFGKVDENYFTGIISDTGLYEFERRKIAYHLSLKATYKDFNKEILEVFENTNVWVSRNGYIEQEKSFFIFVGFWFAVIVSFISSYFISNGSATYILSLKYFLIFLILLIIIGIILFLFKKFHNLQNANKIAIKICINYL